MKAAGDWARLDSGGSSGNDNPITTLRDSTLWILDNKGGVMERSRLRAAIGMRQVLLLNPILEELTGKAEAAAF